MTTPELDDMLDAEPIPFHWIDRRLLMNTRKQGFLGLCSRTGRIAKVAPPGPMGALQVAGLNDFYVSDDQCEEGQRCLDIQCDLNRTTEASYRHALGLGKGRFPDDFLKKPMPLNEDAEALAWFRQVIDEHPDHGVVVTKEA